MDVRLFIHSKIFMIILHGKCSILNQYMLLSGATRLCRPHVQDHSACILLCDLHNYPHVLKHMLTIRYPFLIPMEIYTGIFHDDKSLT